MAHKTAPVMDQDMRIDAYHVVPDSPQNQRDFLEVLASLSARSSEPWAKDVLRVAEINNVLPVSVEGFQEYAGRGLGGLVTLPNEHRPRAVVMGTREFIAECGLQIPDIVEVAARNYESQDGAQILLTGWDAWIRGVVKFVHR